MLRLYMTILALLTSATINALTIRPPSFSELVTAADSVVFGEVTHIETVLRKIDDRATPFTLVTIQVAETLKGTPVPAVVLQLLGGTAGSETLRVIGTPEFTVGDRGFFFVQNNGTQFFPLVGITHGIYPAILDDATGTEIVTRSDGQPLVATAQVSEPLESKKHSASPAPFSGRALTSAQFANFIKAELSHASR